MNVNEFSLSLSQRRQTIGELNGLTQTLFVIPASKLINEFLETFPIPPLGVDYI